MNTYANIADSHPLVSVIIPVYKVEDYLAECIDSVINQTYRNLEIILVDDGSPDGCGTMCDAYAAQDDRVRVIHKTNGGQSSARNAALEVMTGEFITFLDSDDWMYRGTIEGYMQCFAKHPELDLVESGIYFTSSGEPCNVGEYIGDPQAEDRLLTGAELLHTFSVNMYSVSMPAPWNKCYRRELLRGHRFVEGRVYEDLEFHLRLYPHVKSYLRWEQVNYYYRVSRPGSTTDHNSSITKNLSQLHDCCEILKQIVLDLEKQKSEGVLMVGAVSVEEYRNYVLTWLMTFLQDPPNCPLLHSHMRRKLMPVLRPYVEFVVSRPFHSQRKGLVLAHRMMGFSYPLYMHVFLPLLFKYSKLKKKLGLSR